MAAALTVGAATRRLATDRGGNAARRRGPVLMHTTRGGYAHPSGSVATTTTASPTTTAASGGVSATIGGGGARTDDADGAVNCAGNLMDGMHAVSSGFKRESIPIKNHDAQSFICWIHVLILWGLPEHVPVVNCRCKPLHLRTALDSSAATHKGIATWDCTR